MIDSLDLLMFYGLDSEGEGEYLATVDVCMLLLIGDDHLARPAGVVCCDGLVICVHQFGDAVMGQRGRRSRPVAGPESIFVDLFQYWSFLRVLI